MDAGLGELVAGALRLDPGAFIAIELAPQGLRTALLILLIAGASETLGQAVVLILNQVSRPRFALAVGLGGLELVVEATVWVIAVWAASRVFVPASPSFTALVRVIGLAYAPLLLGVLEFFPYIGPLIARLLRLWVLLAVIVGMTVVFELSPAQTAIMAAVGFACRVVLLKLFSRVSAVAERWLWRAQTGRATPLRSADVLVPLEPREHHG